MAKGDIIPVVLSGVAASDDGLAAIEFNDGNLVIAMPWQDIAPFLMAVGEAGAKAREFQSGRPETSEFAFQTSKLAVRQTTDRREVRFQFDIVGGFQLNVVVPTAGLPQLIEGLQGIVAKGMPSANGMN